MYQWSVTTSIADSITLTSPPPDFSCHLIVISSPIAERNDAPNSKHCQLSFHTGYRVKYGSHRILSGYPTQYTVRLFPAKQTIIRILRFRYRDDTTLEIIIKFYQIVKNNTQAIFSSVILPGWWSSCLRIEAFLKTGHRIALRVSL